MNLTFSNLFFRVSLHRNFIQVKNTCFICDSFSSSVEYKLFHRRRMIFYECSRWHWLTLWIVWSMLFLSVFLKLHQYSIIPHNTVEYSHELCKLNAHQYKQIQGHSKPLKATQSCSKWLKAAQISILYLIISFFKIEMSYRWIIHNLHALPYFRKFHTQTKSAWELDWFIGKWAEKHHR